MLLQTFLGVTDAPLAKTITQSTSVIQNIITTFFNLRSLGTLLIFLAISLFAGRLIAILLRRVGNTLSHRADTARTIDTVNQLRTWETYIILSIALIRMLLVFAAVYLWWQVVHPSSGSSATAILSAGAVLTLILSGSVGPLLRDFAFGAGMMVEHWYGVGDFIAIDQIPHAQGVVERVTLRSTRIRSVNGEVMWISNQNIASVRVAQRGVIPLALELFVTDRAQGERLIEATNLRLPTAANAVATPLSIVRRDELDHNLWHITAQGEVAAGREWFLERFAVQVIKDLDRQAKQPVLVHDPIARYADTEAEQRFERTIKNSRKAVRERQRLRRRTATKPVRKP